MTAYVLNLFDLLCTLCALELGVKELNPFMQTVPIMAFYKVVVVGGLLYVLSRMPGRLAAWGMKVCTAFYAALAIYHVIGLVLIEGVMK